MSQFSLVTGFLWGIERKYFTHILGLDDILGKVTLQKSIGAGNIFFRNMVIEKKSVSINVLPQMVSAVNLSSLNIFVVNNSIYQGLFALFSFLKKKNNCHTFFYERCAWFQESSHINLMTLLFDCHERFYKNTFYSPIILPLITVHTAFMLRSASSFWECSRDLLNSGCRARHRSSDFCRSLQQIALYKWGGAVSQWGEIIFLNCIGAYGNH